MNKSHRDSEVGAKDDRNIRSERSATPADAHSFASTVANFFRKNAVAQAPPSAAARAPMPAQARATLERPPIAHEPATAGDLREQAMSRSHLSRHWQAIKNEGISASEFIAFLQPLADLEGIAVSYIYSDTDGKERIYNHRAEDQSFSNPLSRAIRDKKLTREKALSFALNDQGKVWIESNFIELK